MDAWVEAPGLGRQAGANLPLVREHVRVGDAARAQLLRQQRYAALHLVVNTRQVRLEDPYPTIQRPPAWPRYGSPRNSTYL